jgi:carbamoyltransferase
MFKDKGQSYLGLAKVIFNSSICHVSVNEAESDVEIVSTERITRKKSNGTWPYKAIELIKSKFNDQAILIAENRDVFSPKFFEEKLNIASPFFDFLKKRNLEKYSSHFNPEVKYLGHHLAHAYSCLAMSPFDESLIIIMDGAGSATHDYEGKFPAKNENMHEEYSVYLQLKGKIECVDKTWQKFEKANKAKEHSFAESIGLLYEKAAEFIFNSKTSAGKVMGLAPFGEACEVIDPKEYLDKLPWGRAYDGKSKKEWEESESLEIYKNIAASTQNYFEKVYIDRIKDLKKKYPHIENIIIAGGCALNCVSNMKLYNEGVFKNIYIPPFPGDGGISFGLAHYLMYENGVEWKKIEHEDQHGYFGPKSSIPVDESVEEIFIDYKISKHEDITEIASELLKENNIIAWYQGRSESGPRALGNRSILARIDYPNLKNYLNEKIKFREAFRPYGCSVIQEKAHIYFDIPENFQNPYMSFAVPLRENFKDMFKEVSHIDGTSRKQSVTKGQNERFYNLISKVGEKTGTYAVLNTSLNIMGEPIVETIDDVKNFFDNSEVDALCVGNYLIERV